MWALNNIRKRLLNYNSLKTVEVNVIWVLNHWQAHVIQGQVQKLEKTVTVFFLYSYNWEVVSIATSEIVRVRIEFKDYDKGSLWNALKCVAHV